MTLTIRGADGAAHPWMRPLGQLGRDVSAVTAGGSPLGSMPRLYGREVSAREGTDTVAAVLASPIRTIDTSNGYSDGESERRIGAAAVAAGGFPPDVTVITKVDAKGTDYSGDRVRASVDESRQRLGLDHLPLVHLHDPEYHDFDELTAPGGAVDALVGLKEAGVVGAIGLAGGRVQVMARYLALDVFDALLVHNRWTLLDRSAGGLLDAAQARGLTLINAAVYGGGILAAPSVPAGATYGYRPAPPDVLESVRAMHATCRRHGVDLATAALQFSLRDARFTTTVVGMSRPERVASTMAAATATVPDDLWPELEALLPPRHTWLDAPFD
ncbi:aldo/keto reductase [Isoptericola sp. b441]|uniref:Aldo/keto reductase n=1 Tax=Actinotalea lenta TaxID=3064654 RepID=A0ABT9D7C5_9CELL|nr:MULTISPECIES: aldo/keto reductase [unclassified Isoptericola]MDO8106742.1 aldo/keto reductase [Isoptericola sp. b441]MDO8121546.1 aldo/keto reductase [Isoptericola sp. b490]